MPKKKQEPDIEMLSDDQIQPERWCINRHNPKDKTQLCNQGKKCLHKSTCYLESQTDVDLSSLNKPKNKNCLGEQFKKSAEFRNEYCKKKCNKHKKCLKIICKNEQDKIKQRLDDFNKNKFLWYDFKWDKLPKVSSNTLPGKNKSILNQNNAITIKRNNEDIEVFMVSTNRISIKKDKYAKLPTVRQVKILNYIYHHIYKNNVQIFSLHELASIYEEKIRPCKKSCEIVKGLMDIAENTTFYINEQDYDEKNPKYLIFEYKQKIKLLSSCDEIRIRNKWKNFTTFYMIMPEVKVQNGDFLYYLQQNAINEKNGRYLPSRRYNHNKPDEFEFLNRIKNMKTKKYTWNIETLAKEIYQLKYSEINKKLHEAKQITDKKEQKKMILKAQNMDRRQRRKVIKFIYKFEYLLYEFDHDLLTKHQKFRMTETINHENL